MGCVVQHLYSYPYPMQSLSTLPSYYDVISIAGIPRWQLKTGCIIKRDIFSKSHNTYEFCQSVYVPIPRRSISVICMCVIQSHCMYDCWVIRCKLCKSRSILTPIGGQTHRSQSINNYSLYILYKMYVCYSKSLHVWRLSKYMPIVEIWVNSHGNRRADT